MNKKEKLKIKENKLKKAVGYAMTLVQFQEVHGGCNDKNLGDVRILADTLVELCLNETDIKLTTYPTQFLRDNSKLVIGEITFTLKEIIKKEKVSFLFDKKCVICKKTYNNFGNNAEPLVNGRCCDNCNIKVIEERLKRSIKKRSVKQEMIIIVE